MPASTTRRASAARTSCTCCTTPTSRSSMPACRTIRGSARWSRLWKGVTQVRRPGRDRRFAARRLPASPRRAARTEVSRKTRSKREAAGRGSAHDAYDVEPGDKVHARRSGHRRPLHARPPASTTGSPRSAWCCWRCPGWRCSIPSLFFLTGLFGGGADDARDPSLDRRGAVRQLPRPVHPLLARQSVEPRRTATGCGTLGDVLDRPRGEAARGRQVQCRPEVRLLGDVDPDPACCSPAAS